jgi:hypothetical protein
VLDLAGRHGWKGMPWPVGALVVLAVSDVLGGRPEQALADVIQAEGVAAATASTATPSPCCAAPPSTTAAGGPRAGS